MTKPITKTRKRASTKTPEVKAISGPSGKVHGQPAGPISPAPSRPNKGMLVLALLGRDEGATLPQMVEATGWQAHTTRAALTGLRKKGHEIAGAKIDGVRVYRIVTPTPPSAPAKTGDA